METTNSTLPSNSQEVADAEAAAVADLLKDVNDSEDLVPVKSVGSNRNVKRDLVWDEASPSVALGDLSQRSGLSVDDLYNRARGRGCLIEAPYRTAAQNRRVYEEDLEEVLAPKRGKQDNVPEKPLPAEVLLDRGGPCVLPPPVASPTPAPTSEGPLKLIALYREGRFTADETLLFIEALLTRRS